MSNIDDLLSSAGISQQESAPVSATALGEDDIASILSEHGFHGEDNVPVPQAVDEAPDSMNSEESEDRDETGFDEEGEVHEEHSAEAPEDGLIAPNSPTLLLDDSTSRFSGTEWYDEIQKQRVILAGLGGIGSSCAYNLARMHLASLVLYDDDIVDWSNLSGQFYSKDDVGMHKVDAAQAELLKYATTTNIYAVANKFDHTRQAGDIMMCGFDNMAARKTFFTAWKRHLRGMSQEERAKCLFLDGRLSVSVMQVFCITGDDDYNIERYRRDYLFSDSEADPEYDVCSLKQTTYLASMIGALMTNLFTNFVANQLFPVIPYKLPFFTEYDANYMIFKEVG